MRSGMAKAGKIDDCINCIVLFESNDITFGQTQDWILLQSRHRAGSTTMLQSTTSQQIAALLQKMPEGDRVRVLRFAEALIAQKSGKRAQRAKRFQKNTAHF